MLVEDEPVPAERKGCLRFFRLTSGRNQRPTPSLTEPTYTPASPPLSKSPIGSLKGDESIFKDPGEMSEEYRRQND